MRPDVAICLATYRRPQLLRVALEALEEQVLPGQLRVEIRVVDNDADGSARAIVEQHARQSRFPIQFAVEEERNIALARNRAIDLGPARFYAFVDDDERADREWLAELLACALDSDADAVIGAVRADLPANAPAWLRRSRVLDKPVWPSLGAGAWRAARTANALYDSRRLGPPRFDPSYGRTGGEDTAFFRTLTQLDGRLAWAPAAIVVEDAHPDRWRLSWHWRRSLRAGRSLSRMCGRRRWSSIKPLARACCRLLIGTPAAALGFPRQAVLGLLGIATAYGNYQGAARARAYPDEALAGYASTGIEARNEGGRSQL